MHSIVDALKPLAVQRPLSEVTVHEPFSPGSVKTLLTNLIAHEQVAFVQEVSFPDALLHTALVLTDVLGGPCSP